MRLSGARERPPRGGGEDRRRRNRAGPAGRFWNGIREQTDPFFAGEGPLWRLSLPSHAPRIELPGAQLIEWGGALRWLKTSADAATVRAAAARRAAMRRCSARRGKAAGAFAPLPAALARLHRELKGAFDPAGILNPGRLYAEF